MQGKRRELRVGLLGQLGWFRVSYFSGFFSPFSFNQLKSI
jgi:hypothetical protein